MLAIAVGGLGVVLALWFGWAYVDGQFRARRTKIEGLEGEIGRFEKQVLAAQRAKRKLVEYEERSLPPSQDQARFLYQQWLLARLEQAGFSEQQVRTQGSQPEGELYVKHTFIVTGKANLAQLVELLHSLYSVDYLHRITHLTVKPIKDRKELDVTFNIDAVSVTTAPEAKALHTRPSSRLTHKSKEDYLKRVLGRNLFGPPNRSPTLSVSGSKDVGINRQAELTLRGSDPDRIDKVRYRLIESAAPEARLDTATGRFAWTPRSLGKYKFLVEVYDDGYPSLTKREEIVLSVVDPLPSQPRPTFDKARFTFLTAVTEVDGTVEAWLRIRTDDRIERLQVGQEFEIGSVKGKVESIGAEDLTFVSDGKVRKLDKNSSLDQAVTVAQSGETE
jgi:hypothetical protein